MSGDAFYYVLFAAFGLPVVALVWTQGIGGHSDINPAQRAFRNNYLLVWSLQMLGDWLQGPYVYALYELYGYSPKQIGQLFIAGFGSSLVFGTFIGSLADRMGRRNASLAYVVTYSLSCVTKHSPEFHILMLGRILGGIATSLLYSAFESWLVAEHFKRGYSEQSLGQTFSWSVFLGNGLMAIASGQIGDTLVERLQLGRVAPFDAAIVAMLIGGVVILMTWGENYGDSSSKSLTQQFNKAWAAIEADPCIWLLGLMQSMFEASMYSFVFLWTMALSPNKEAIKHGLIFMNFMTACMLGSYLSGILMKMARPEKYMKHVFLGAGMALLVPCLMHLDPSRDPSLKGQPITLQGKIQMVFFCIFEVAVGIFWPSMMKMRATYVPDELRATIINLFRIPLNLFVCLVLANVEAVPLWAMFALCSSFLIISCICQAKLDHHAAARNYHAQEKKKGVAGGGRAGGSSRRAVKAA